MSEVSDGGAALRDAVIEVERFVDDDGWDQPSRLFALVSTRHLVAAEPDLAGALAAHEQASKPDALTPVEQDIDLSRRSLEELLATIAWPQSVIGALAVMERVVLPPEAESDIPGEREAAERFAAEHPRREDVRLVAGVLRSGAVHCVIRLRSIEGDDGLIDGDDLVPGLVLALRETLEVEAGDDVRRPHGGAAEAGPAVGHEGQRRAD